VFTYEDWIEFANRPSSISTVENIYWLDKGCPKCGGVDRMAAMYRMAEQRMEDRDV
jgi:hypothetical protein